jgi:hypothetical protein
VLGFLLSNNAEDAPEKEGRILPCSSMTPMCHIFVKLLRFLDALHMKCAAKKLM